MSVQPSTTLLILGAGGHGRVVADAALAQGTWQQVRVTDNDAAKYGSVLMAGLDIEPLQHALRDAGAVHIAIGSAAAREKQARGLSLPFATVLHPRASISRYAEIRPGCFVAAGAVVAPGARVGIGVIVNHGAVVDHDVQVGDFTHVAPLAAVGGNARVGRRVLVGAGAQVLPGVRVCDDVVIGAGAAVVADIDTPGVYAGVPARRVR
ncbi:MAG: acetyltransferase [Ramlibacter sp.]|nr:acetyltransferase [Ramlibacter sp.]MDB5912324.1 acetyltransferase [Ramlibacter sp.]